MMGAWVELLPLFMVRWLAVGRCERMNLGGTEVVTARPDVFIRARAAAVAPEASRKS